MRVRRAQQNHQKKLNTISKNQKRKKQENPTKYYRKTKEILEGKSIYWSKLQGDGSWNPESFINKKKSEQYEERRIHTHGLGISWNRRTYPGSKDHFKPPLHTNSVPRHLYGTTPILWLEGTIRYTRNYRQPKQTDTPRTGNRKRREDPTALQLR